MARVFLTKGSGRCLESLSEDPIRCVKACANLLSLATAAMQTHLKCFVLQGKCTFGPRLSDVEIQRLSQYVVDKAEQGWQ